MIFVRKNFLAALCLAGVMALAGCASSDPVYYTLQAQPGAIMAAPVRVIELRRVTLPGYLDRADIVRGTQNYRLDVSDGARWGEPLGDMIGRVLAANLSQRLPASTVFGTAGAITLPPDARIEVDVRHFDAGADGVVTLDATTAIWHGQQMRDARHVVLSAAKSGTGPAAEAAAMSNLLAQLADGIATRLTLPAN